VDVREKIFPPASETAVEVVVVGVNEKQLKEHEMNVIQLCAFPLRIRIEDQATGTGGSGSGQDFELTTLGEEYATFVKIENTSQTPEDQNG
jgi:hypothetical protein